MIVVRNRGHEPVVVRHSETMHEGVIVRPMDEHSFTGLTHGHFVVDRAPARRMDRRFDPRGGDPYNRVGTRALP